jgi:hypothetical protein
MLLSQTWQVRGYRTRGQFKPRAVNNSRLTVDRSPESQDEGELAIVAPAARRTARRVLIDPDALCVVALIHQGPVAHG